MGMWMEIRCERRADDAAAGSYNNHCWSHDNAGPMGMADDNRASLVATARDLEREARHLGWRKIRDGWVCPFCVTTGDQP